MRIRIVEYVIEKHGYEFALALTQVLSTAFLVIFFVMLGVALLVKCAYTIIRY